MKITFSQFLALVLKYPFRIGNTYFESYCPIHMEKIYFKWLNRIPFTYEYTECEESFLEVDNEEIETNGDQVDLKGIEGTLISVHFLKPFDIEDFRWNLAANDLAELQEKRDGVL